MGNIAIIIPARNEAARLGAVLQVVVEFKKSSKDKVSIIVVDNDSVDGTPGVVSAAQKMKDSEIILLEEKRRGKKNASLTGINHAMSSNPEIIVTLDAGLINLKKEHVQALIEGAHKSGMCVGVLPVFLRGKSEALKQFRVEMSGQRAYSAEKLQQLLSDEKIKNMAKHGPGNGFETFIYRGFKKTFNEPEHVTLHELEHAGNFQKGILFPRTRGLIMNAQAFYYRWKAKRL